MTVENFYLFCFAFGFLFSLVSLIVGHLDLGGGHGGNGGHGDLTGHGYGHHGHGHNAAAHYGAAHHERAGQIDGGHEASSKPVEISAFNMSTLAAFLAWFGGSGYVMTRYFGVWLIATLLAASLVGVAGGWIVLMFLRHVLMRDQSPLNPADFEMVGVLGVVSGNIRAEGIGEILFTQAGTRRACAARSETGTPIANGTEVVVTNFENGIAYVRRWEDMAGEWADTQGDRA